MKVIWPERALARLSEIQDFIARANPNAGGRLVQRIVKRGDGLAPARYDSGDRGV